MRRHSSHTIECRRRGCARRMHPRDTFCARCWAAVPGWLKARLAQARKAADSALITGLMIKASTFAADAAAPAPRVTATEVYARNAALLGETD
jgi:hypothetical protein